jgi:nicotinate-nucleotide adenylyltransferase
VDEAHRRQSVVRLDNAPTGGTALFGGTFDPIHNAHLEIAREAADRFDLAKILFVPAANPPHKPGGAIASYEDRVRMAEMACAIDPRFEVSRIEAPVGESGSRSYSILTIEKFHAEASGPLAQTNPRLTLDKSTSTAIDRGKMAGQTLGIKPLSFLIGADAFREIRTWHRWRDVVASVEFIVVTRPGADWEIPPGAIVHELAGLDLPVSSSDIRRQVVEGALGIPVPEAVLGYIRDHNLYSQPK